jgi:hypothetical protein
VECPQASTPATGPVPVADDDSQSDWISHFRYAR